MMFSDFQFPDLLRSVVDGAQTVGFLMVGTVGHNALAADGSVQIAIVDQWIFAAVVAEHLQWEDDVEVGWIFAAVAAYLMEV